MTAHAASPPEAATVTTPPPAVDPGLRDRLAETLRGHEPIYRDGYSTGEPPHFVCECGRWISDPEHSDADDPGADHRRHLADALLPVVAAHVEQQARERAAAERDRVLAPIRALHRPAYSGWCGHCADISDGDSEAMWPCTTVQAITQAAATAASPADQPGRKP